MIDTYTLSRYVFSFDYYISTYLVAETPLVVVHRPGALKEGFLLGNYDI